MAFTEFDMASAALAHIGEEPITAFSGSPRATIMGQHYERRVKSVLSSFPWGFAKELRNLGARDTNTPAGLWDYSFDLPADLLKLRGIWRAGKKVKYERFGRKVFTNEDADLVAEYTFRADESWWDPDFVDFMEYDLAAFAARAIAVNFDLAATLAQEAELKRRIARYNDSAQQTTQRLHRGTLVNVRR